MTSISNPGNILAWADIDATAAYAQGAGRRAMARDLSRPIRPLSSGPTAPRPSSSTALLSRYAEHLSA